MGFGIADLLDSYQFPECPKSPVADSAYYDQMFRATKRTVLLAVFDDALGQHAADAGKFFQFRRGSSVDIYSRRVLLTGEGRIRLRSHGCLPIVRI